ncbi:MAG: NAD(P)H-hydrate dehydratase [Clostridia bacterium]|nr:NAD(P)H-hydrate dehydratase [Clostridia bacterium]
MVYKSLDLNTANAMLPKRDLNGNKGTFGKVLLICGSKNMVGCCALATEGALRCGAGLVTLAFPDVLYNSLTARLTENLFLPLPTDDRGFIDYTALPTVLDAAEKADVVMVGCGIGTGFAPSLITTSLIEHCSKPLILDADALNCLSLCPDYLKKAKAPILLTPHPGEMARLTGKSIEEIEKDRLKTAVDFCKEYKVNLLLKGHETVICSSEADNVYINKTGNTGLSKGGAGDLLSGIISGLTPAFKGDLFKSAVLGAFVHGMTSDVLKETYSEYSLLPTDCAKALPQVFSIIEKGVAD